VDQLVSVAGVEEFAEGVVCAALELGEVEGRAVDGGGANDGG